MLLEGVLGFRDGVGWARDRTVQTLNLPDYYQFLQHNQIYD